MNLQELNEIADNLRPKGFLKLTKEQWAYTEKHPELHKAFLKDIEHNKKRGYDGFYTKDEFEQWCYECVFTGEGVGLK